MLMPIKLSDAERGDLVAFLQTFDGDAGRRRGAQAAGNSVTPDAGRCGPRPIVISIRPYGSDVLFPMCGIIERFAASQKNWE